VNNIEIEKVVEQWYKDLPPLIPYQTHYNITKKELVELFATLTQKHEEEKSAAVIAERDRILANILKWSETATVVETTGRGSAARATKKLREHLYGSYHFLYQAVRHNIDLSKTDVTKGL